MQERGAAENHLRGSAFFCIPPAPLRFPEGGAAGSIPLSPSIAPAEGSAVPSSTVASARSRVPPSRIAGAPPSGDGRLLLIAIRWICAWTNSRAVWPVSSSAKMRMAVPSPAAAALPRISGLLHDSADSRPAVAAHPSRTGCRGQSRPYWMVVIATSDRGPEEKAASSRMHQALGRSAAAGEGTAIRVFSKRHDGGCGGGCLVGHIIHMIAISKTVPAPEAWIRGGKPIPRSTPSRAGRIEAAPHSE